MYKYVIAIHNYILINIDYCGLQGCIRSDSSPLGQSEQRDKVPQCPTETCSVSDLHALLYVYSTGRTSVSFE